MFHGVHKNSINTFDQGTCNEYPHIVFLRNWKLSMKKVPYLKLRLEVWKCNLLLTVKGPITGTRTADYILKKNFFFK